MPKHTEYEEKAVRAAAHAQMVPQDLEKLTTRMFCPSRSGPLEPFWDDRDVSSQKRSEAEIRSFESSLAVGGCPAGAR